jgi:hypothetical protein
MNPQTTLRMYERGLKEGRNDGNGMNGRRERRVKEQMERIEGLLYTL